MNIFSLIELIIFNLIDITCIYCLVNNNTKNKKDSVIPNIFYYLLLFTVVTVMGFYKDKGSIDIIEISIVILINIIYLYLYKEGEIYFKIYLSILYISILESVSFVAIIFVEVLYKYTLIDIIYDNLNKRFLYFIVMKIFIIVTSVILINLKQRTYTHINKFIHLIFSLFLSIIIIIITKISLIVSNNFKYDIINTLILCIGLFILNISIIAIYNEYIERVYEKSRLEIEVNKYKLEKRYSEEIYRMYKEMRAWRHDYRNHIQLLAQLAMDNKLNEVKDYILKLDIETSDSECIVYTGNSYIDSILTTKKLLANSLKIDFVLRVSNIKEIKINNLDICTLLSNLLDNSIEACKRMDGKTFIKLDITSIKNQFIIILENSCDGNIKFKDGVYKTSKNSSNHGIGMQQIDSVVQKYDGYINRDYSNNIFKTTILFLNSKISKI